MPEVFWVSLLAQQLLTCDRIFSPERKRTERKPQEMFKKKKKNSLKGSRPLLQARQLNIASCSDEEIG